MIAYVMYNYNQSLKLKSDLALCGKKVCPEHQTLFLAHARGSGNETSLSCLVAHSTTMRMEAREQDSKVTSTNAC